MSEPGEVELVTVQTGLVIVQTGCVIVQTGLVIVQTGLVIVQTGLVIVHALFVPLLVRTYLSFRPQISAEKHATAAPAHATHSIARIIGLPNVPSDQKCTSSVQCAFHHL